MKPFYVCPECETCFVRLNPGNCNLCEAEVSKTIKLKPAFYAEDFIEMIQERIFKVPSTNQDHTYYVRQSAINKAMSGLIQEIKKSILKTKKGERK